MAVVRVSIFRMMVWVAVVGANLGVWRALGNAELVLLNALILVALQLGCYRAVRSRGDGRWFWIGFVAFGVSCPMMAVWFGLFHQTAGAHVWAVRMYEAAIDGSVQWHRSWLRTYQDNALVMGASFAVAAFLPQGVVALVGGFLGYFQLRPCWRLLRMRRTSDRPSSLVRASSAQGAQSHGTSEPHGVVL